MDNKNDFKGQYRIRTPGNSASIPTIFGDRTIGLVTLPDLEPSAYHRPVGAGSVNPDRCLTEHSVVGCQEFALNVALL